MYSRHFTIENRMHFSRRRRKFWGFQGVGMDFTIIICISWSGEQGQGSPPPGGALIRPPNLLTIILMINIIHYLYNLLSILFHYASSMKTYPNNQLKLISCIVIRLQTVGMKPPAAQQTRRRATEILATNQ